MKSLFRMALAVLVLLVVALVSALTAIRVAVHGREVHVPELRQKTIAEARKASESGGLQFVVERQYYSPTIAEGRVLTQVPEPGTLVRRGWQVRVAESLGPQRAQIPDLQGQSQRAAEINLKRRGLELSEVAYLDGSGADIDEVLGQSPAPNAGEVAAPKISLLVAAGGDTQAFVMPNFVGQPLGSVLQAIQDGGMKLAGVGTPATSPDMLVKTVAEDADVVAWQDPAAGQRVVAGSAISFRVR